MVGAGLTVRLNCFELLPALLAARAVKVNVPEEARTAALKLIRQDKVVALMGEIASSNSLAAAPAAQAAKIPMISPGSTNPKVTAGGDYIFRVCFIDPYQGAVMARFAFNDLRLRRVAILIDQGSAYSTGLAAAFRATLTMARRIFSSSKTHVPR